MEFLLGMLVMAVLVYGAVALASWYDSDVKCWYCRVVEALSWPYHLYKAARD